MTRAGIARLLTVGPCVACAAIVAVWLVGFTAPFGDAVYARTLYSADGTLLSARIAPDGQWRFSPGSEALPERYVAALVAFEDKRFFAHAGVDPLALARAALTNLRARGTRSGGSTITMQVARLALSNRPRTYRQKLVELSLALRIELAYSKPLVLRLFAAHAPFGGNVVGLEAAAWRYFGRPPATVTWAEAALLAVLPNSPSMMHLASRRVELEAKRNRLLDRLHERGAIDEHELLLAQGEPIPAAPRPIPEDALHLLGTLAARHGSRERFVTTLDTFYQTRARAIVGEHGARLRGIGVTHAAALIVHVPTGAVRAYVGNLPPSQPVAVGDYVDIVQSPRSTGSLLKPFLYAAMIDSGELLPRQIVPDIPTRIGGYIPENHTGVFTGVVRADVALARSLNVPAARLLQEYGVSRFYSLLKELGMTTLTRPADHYGIPLILGGSESTLWELTGMYASMSRAVSFRRPDAPAIHSPYVLGGAATPPVGTRSPLSPAALYLTLEALREVERPEEFQGWRFFASAGEVSWKTGTSYGLRDAWAIGVNTEYAVGVWVGNATGSGVPGLRGTATAGPIMFQLFELLGRGAPAYSPGGLVQVTVCRDSGFAAGPDCPRTETQLVPAGAHDLKPCPYCRTFHLDASGTVQVSADFYPVEQIVHERRFVLPGAMAYYYQRRSADYLPPPPLDPRLSTARGELPLLEFPRNDSVVYIPVEMTGERGSLVAVARVPTPEVRLFWHLDDAFLGVTEGEHEIEISPPAGVHRLTIVDSRGLEATALFRVLDRE